MPGEHQLGEQVRSHSGAVLTIRSNTVEKLHVPGTDPRLLSRRLELAARLPQLLSPLAGPVVDETGVRSTWPRITPLVAAGPDEVPWEQFARLLAELHQTPFPDDAPLAGTGARWARVLRGLDELAPDVIDIARALPAPGAASERSTVLVHGDAHLGQLGFDGERPVLIDVDDLGLGDPADDLARIAGAWASGQLDLRYWARFLDAYRDAGGPAVSGAGDPWPSLDSAAKRSILTAYYGLRRDRAAPELAEHLLSVILSW